MQSMSARIATSLDTFADRCGTEVYVVKTHGDMRREVNFISALVLLIALSLAVSGAISNWRYKKALKTRREAIAIIRKSTKDFIDITAERAEVYNERQVRVLFAATLRGNSRGESAAFAYQSGYFLDQDGTRYDTQVMLADGDGELLESPSPLMIVPGQVYRYYLVASTHSDPYSDAPPSRR